MLESGFSVMADESVGPSDVVAALFSGTTSFSRSRRMVCASFQMVREEGVEPSSQGSKPCVLPLDDSRVVGGWKGQWVPPPLLVGGSHACIYQHLDPMEQQAGPDPAAFSLATRRSSAELLLRWRHRLESHQRGPGCNRVPESSVTVPGLRRRASNPRRRWVTATRSSAELLRTAWGGPIGSPPYRHGVPTPGLRAENPVDCLYPMAAW